MLWGYVLKHGPFILLLFVCFFEFGDFWLHYLYVYLCFVHWEVETLINQIFRIPRYIPIFEYLLFIHIFYLINSLCPFGPHYKNFLVFIFQFLYINSIIIFSLLRAFLILKLFLFKKCLFLNYRSQYLLKIKTPPVISNSFIENGTFCVKMCTRDPTPII